MTKYSSRAISEAVDRAANFFEQHPDKWTKAKLARDGRNWSVDPRSPEAVSWCALGRIAKELDIDPEEVLTEEQIEAIEGSHLESYYVSLQKIGLPTTEIFGRNDSLYRQYENPGKGINAVPAIVDMLRTVSLEVQGQQ